MHTWINIATCRESARIYLKSPATLSTPLPYVNLYYWLILRTSSLTRGYIISYIVQCRRVRLAFWGTRAKISGSSIHQGLSKTCALARDEARTCQRTIYQAFVLIMLSQLMWCFPKERRTLVGPPCANILPWLLLERRCGSPLNNPEKCWITIRWIVHSLISVNAKRETIQNG